MLDFIVVGLPRSGTTWAANWLITDTTLCIHDPLYKYTIEQLDELKDNNKKIGISCTGIYLFPEYLRSHPAKKLIIHRDIKEVNDSIINEIGALPIESSKADELWNILGHHINYEDLFVPKEAQLAYEYLLDKQFDAVRHAYLCELNIQPNFGKLYFDKEVVKNFRQRLNG